VLAGRQSAKVTPLPRTLDKDAVSVTWRRDSGFSLSSTVWHSTKSLPSAREKVLGKDGFTDVLCAEPRLPSATLGKVFVECFSGFAECGKAVDSGSA
jgi:hypothetical protein